MRIAHVSRIIIVRALRTVCAVELAPSRTFWLCRVGPVEPRLIGTLYRSALWPAIAVLASDAVDFRGNFRSKIEIS